MSLGLATFFGQNMQFEDLPFGLWASFTIFWHFIDFIKNALKKNFDDQ